MKFFPALAVVVALLAPVPALANAVIRVKCSSDCKVKVADKRGEKVSESEYLYQQIPAGIWEVEVSRGFKGGFADIPESGEVEILLSNDTMLVNGQFALDKKGKKLLERARKEALEAAKKAERAAAKGEASPTTEPSTAAAQPAKKKTKVLVVGLTAKEISQDTADLFCDALVGELRKRNGYEVADRADIASVIGAEREKQLLGCSDGSCMAELGGALGAEYIVRGDVGRVGRVLKVHLVLSDAQKGASAATVSELIKSEANEAFFDKVPKFVDMLLRGLASAK